MSPANRAPFWTSSSSPTRTARRPACDFIVGLGLRLARRDAQRALLRQHDLAQFGSAAALSIGVSAKPVLDDLGVAQPGLRAPFAICVGDRLQQVAVELLLMAMMRKEVLDRFVGKPHRLPELRLDKFRRAKSGHRIGGLRRSASGNRRAPSSPRRRLRHCTSAIRLSSPRASASREEIGERRPGQLLLGSALDRA